MWTPYDQAIVIDGLCEAFETANDRLPLAGKVLDAIARSGLTAVNFTVPYPGDDFETTVRKIAFVEAAVGAHDARLLLVRKHADIARAKQDGKLGIIAGFQSTEMLGEEPSRIELFRRLGVLVMQLTYSNRSQFGGGCLDAEDGGLTPLGRDAIAVMNAGGVVVDLSHTGWRTTAEAITASSTPVLITHTGCNAVHPHPRNTGDRELRAVAERGGVVGIYLMPFLSAGPEPVSTDDLLAHLDHALEVCGDDHVAIGSDQRILPIRETAEYRKELEEDVERRARLGIAAPGEGVDRPPFIRELNGLRRMELIAEAMSASGRSDAVIEKVLGGNLQRVLGEIWVS